MLNSTTELDILAQLVVRRDQTMDENATADPVQPKSSSAALISGFLGTAKAVLLNPRAFFASMPPKKINSPLDQFSPGGVRAIRYREVNLLPNPDVS